MINYLWTFLMIFSLFCSIFKGTTDLTSTAVIDGTKASIDFLISTTGTMAFWSGIIKIAEKSKLPNLIGKILKPLTKLLFPKVYKNKELMHAICMAITANFLGLGNASTPFGINTVKKIENAKISKEEKQNTLNLFLILSIAGIQLMPNLLISLIQQHSTESPFNILPAAWLTSFLCLTFGILCVKFFNLNLNLNFHLPKSKLINKKESLKAQEGYV